MISIVKLLNSSELIGDIVNDEKESITLNNPLVINYRYKNELSPPIISLLRYSSFTSTKDITLKKEHILTMLSPTDNMIRYYKTSLKNIVEHIDPAVDQELATAAGEESDLSPESQAKLALIERHVTKATLN